MTPSPFGRILPDGKSLRKMPNPLRKQPSLWQTRWQTCQPNKRIWGISLVVPHRSAVDCASTWPTKGLGGAVNAVQYCSKLAAPKDLLIYVVQRGNFPR